MNRTKLAPAAALLVAICTASARAHDDARLHVHLPVNGCALYTDDIAAAPARSLAWFARVPASVWGVASLAVAATLLRRRRAAPSGAWTRAAPRRA